VTAAALAVALAAALAWAVLLLGRGRFWLARDDDDDADRLPEPSAWPAVVAIVPARDEAETIGETVRSLLAQDYPGAFRLVVVDDRSTDGTGAVARAAAGGDPRLTVVTGGPRPAGWTGKLWALQQGLEVVGPADGQDSLPRPGSPRSPLRGVAWRGRAGVGVAPRAETPKAPPP
jgi:cellulose synthase/poly-beta-1,6-N-acetylglucosamine synthase-like glycosyltransferase